MRSTATQQWTPSRVCGCSPPLRAERENLDNVLHFGTVWPPSAGGELGSRIPGVALVLLQRILRSPRAWYFNLLSFCLTLSPCGHHRRRSPYLLCDTELSSWCGWVPLAARGCLAPLRWKHYWSAAHDGFGSQLSPALCSALCFVITFPACAEQPPDCPARLGPLPGPECTALLPHRSCPSGLQLLSSSSVHW